MHDVHTYSMSYTVISQLKNILACSAVRTSNTFKFKTFDPAPRKILMLENFDA